MATSEELLQDYLDAEDHYEKERERFVAVWSAGEQKPPTELFDEKAVAYLRGLGDDVEERRQAWLDSYRHRSS